MNDIITVIVIIMLQVLSPQYISKFITIIYLILIHCSTYGDLSTAYQSLCTLKLYDKYSSVE